MYNVVLSNMLGQLGLSSFQLREILKTPKDRKRKQNWQLCRAGVMFQKGEMLDFQLNRQDQISIHSLQFLLRSRTHCNAWCTEGMTVNYGQQRKPCLNEHSKQLYINAMFGFYKKVEYISCRKTRNTWIFFSKEESLKHNARPEF